MFVTNHIHKYIYIYNTHGGIGSAVPATKVDI